MSPLATNLKGQNHYSRGQTILGGKQKAEITSYKLKKYGTKVEICRNRYIRMICITDIHIMTKFLVVIERFCGWIFAILIALFQSQTARSEGLEC